jgi:signal transduction histidine kinase
MKEELTIDSIREKLSTTLNSQELDIGQVIALTAELAKLDPNNVRFSTDAGIITRLGRELVSRHETAVAELIKNAYDADSRKVELKFIDAEWGDGSLMITDDGLGMSRQQLIDGFMRLSSNDKSLFPYSSRFKRRRAGQKGIGRFAVQRLGTQLTITTQTLESDTALQVDIDWQQFESGVDLASIASAIKEVPKNREEGTTLSINHLREGWSEAAIRRVYRYVSDLLQPFPLSDPRINTERNSLDDIDPGFKVTLIRKSEGDEYVVASEEDSIFPYALAEIEGFVDEVGNASWSIKSDLLNFSTPLVKIGNSNDNTNALEHLRNASLKAYYFIWDTSLVPRAMFKTLKDLAEDKGGIRVYRNGFRVLPYGERNDDWLELDKSNALRRILPPHSNTNYFGFVQLYDPTGIFIETSSREGFTETPQFFELQDFCYRVVRLATLKVAEARNVKQTSGQRDWKKKSADASATITAAAERLEDIADKIQYESERKQSDTDKQEFKSIAFALREAVTQQSDYNQELLAENGMLRVLASLGLIIGEFTHEVRQTLGAAHLNSRRLVRMLPSDSKEHNVAAELFDNIQRFWSYASYFDRSISDNASRELEPQNIRALALDFIETIKTAADRVGIEIELVAEGNDLITIPMHSSELASIFFNFYSNSQKAIKRAKRRGKVRIKLGEIFKQVYIEFSDNGDGIPDENKARIFNAFFTTANSAGKLAYEEEELQGTGLGLKIVRDIVEGYNGEVFITTPPSGFATTIRIELPKAPPTEDRK